MSIEIEDDVVCEDCGWLGYGGETEEDDEGRPHCPECGSEGISPIDFDDDSYLDYDHYYCEGQEK